MSDIRLYREGLELVLRNQPGFKVVGSTDAAAAAGELVGRVGSGIILVDTGIEDAVGTIRNLSRFGPGVQVIALTLSVTNTPAEVLSFAEAGAIGYVTRNAPVPELLRAIESSVKGELHCSPSVAAALARHVGALATRREAEADLPRLTRRELRVLDQIERGLSNKEIARYLGIEVATVKNHVHHILEKLGVRRRGEAVAAMERLRRSGHGAKSAG